MIITVKQIMNWAACYPRDRVKALIGNGKTPLEILDLDIPADDRLWVVLREEVVPTRQLHELACTWAERVLPIFEALYPGDSRPRSAIECKRRWLAGKATDAELAAAEKAVRAAAWDAACAARAAACAATWAAAGDARAAACAATWAAVRAAAWDAQLSDVRRVLEESAE